MYQGLPKEVPSPPAAAVTATDPQSKQKQNNSWSNQNTVTRKVVYPDLSHALAVDVDLANKVIAIAIAIAAYTQLKTASLQA